MATLPIPASMIATGNGPNQIPVRGADATIPGVPVIYHRTLSDEVATLLRESTPSGFLRGGRLVSTLSVVPLARDRVYFNCDDGVEAVVDGYRVQLGDDQLAIELSTSGVTGTRDDCLFFEFWFIRSAGGGRAMQWRVRVQDNTNFATYPDGLGDPNIKARGANPTNTVTVFTKTHAQFPHVARDPGLYIAALAAGENDPLSERGADGNPYILVYALPLGRVHRLNQTAYDRATNSNGGASYNAAQVSTRPDGLWYDTIDVDYQVVDLRNTVRFDKAPEPQLHQMLVDMLQNKLQARGRYQQITRLLGVGQFRGHWGDRAALDQISVATNMVRYSHFRSDSNSDGVADGYTAYNTGFTAGTRALVAGGQKLTRTSADSSNHWGVGATINGFRANRLRVRLGVTPNSSDPLTHFVVAGYDGSTEMFAVHVTGLNSGLGTLREVSQIVDLAAWESALDIRVYLVGGAADVTVRYVDIRTDDRAAPVMEVTDGSVFSIPLSAELSALSATYDDASVLVYDGLDGSLVAGDVDLLVGGTIEFRPNIIEATRDLRISLNVEYPTGGGFPDVFSQFSRAWDMGGFISPITLPTTSAALTAQNVGYPFAAGEGVTAYNPLQSNRGTVATLRIQGNGTGTYTVPATKFGRNVLMPVAVRVASLAVGLASSVRNNDNTWTIVLASSQTVVSSATFEVDVALDAAVVVSDARSGGADTIAKSTLLKIKTTAVGTQVSIPAPGVVRGIGQNFVTNPVIVNGTAQSLAVAMSYTATNVPVVTLTFPSPFAAGDVIELLALVDYEMYEGSGITVSYAINPLPTVPLSGPTPVRLLTQPVLVAHTKGSGGTDTVGDFGVPAFVSNETLASQLISYNGDTAVTTVLYDMPIRRNTLLGAPLHAGRVVEVDDFNDTSLLVEGSLLGQSYPHASVVAALVDAGGRELLMVLDEVRSDNKTRVTDAASVTFYEPNGRPIALAPLP